MSLYGFISSVTLPLENDTRVTANLVGMGRRMRVVIEAIKVRVEYLPEGELKGIFVKTKALVKWKCVPQLVFYGCDASRDENW